MRYDDASQPVSNGHSEPVARPDTDILSPGSFGPATGNAITGQGTNSGAAGADSVGASPAITQVQGAGGQTVVSNGNFQVPGQYGILQMDAQGNFNYVRNPNTPDGVKDVFNYTVADAAGNSSTTLTIDIAQVAAAAAGQGVVALPAGVQLSDIHINGHDLVINMPDGTQMVIPNGAVFVPEITIGDVQVPPTNIAALLIDTEPQPAAGPSPSSGGDWNDPVPPLDPGVPLGDLIPPTELTYTPPVFVEAGGAAHEPPTVVIETPDNPPPGVVDASEQVFEKGLPARDGNLPNEPAGSGEIADGNGTNNSDPSETNTGTIVFTAQGGLQTITVDGTAITQVGQTIQGQYGTMTITGIDLAHDTITYSYTLADNTSGDNTADHFTVVVTDKTGDTATATLTVNIVDDVPTARNDTDSLDSNHTATGNVMTGAGTTSGAAGADTVGADNASLTSVSSNFSHQSDATFDASGNLIVHGEFGTLTIMADGSYVYTLDQGTHGGSNDVFTYTITDGDGDTSSATLTINVPFQDNPPTASDSAVNVSEEGLQGGIPDSNGSPDTTDSPTASGTITASDPDGDPLTIKLGTPSGSYTSHGQVVNWSVSSDGHTLTGYTGSDPSSNHVVTVVMHSDGTYDVTLVQPFDDPNPNVEDSINFVVPVNVSDGTLSTDVHITVTVEDDSPAVSLADVDIPSLTVDETNLGTDDSKSFANAFNVAFGADGPAASNSLVYTLGISATGADSGLIDTASGNHVFLFVQGGEVVGKEGSDATAAASGPVVFTVSIDAATGEVTLDQSRAVVQPDGTNPDTSEGVTLSAANLVTITATATDYDGDHASQTLNIGNQLNFLDDGPTASPDTNSTDAGTTLTVTAASSSDVLHNDAPGADGYAAGGGVVGVEAGTDTSVTLSTGVGTVIHGTYGDLTLNADGSYSYVAKPNVSGVDHFVYTIADGDGDTSTTTLNITVNPVTAVVGTGATIVSEEVLLGGTEHGGDTDSDSSNDVLVNSGNITLTDSISGATFTTALTAPPGTYTSGGVTITWALSNGGHTLTGSAGATTVLVATIDNSGHYTVTLSAPIDTPNGVNAGENGGDSILAIGVTATDNFGNTLTSGTLTVNVEDDHPIASPDTNSTSAGTTLTVTVASSSDVLHNDVSGADGYAAGGGVVGVAAGTNTSVALSTGVGTVIHGTYGDLTLNADGSYSYVAKPNVTGVDHFVYTIADGDGDTSTTTLNITVNPVTAVVGTGATIVSEEVLLGGTEHGGDTDSDSSNDVLVNSGNITLTDSISGATFTTALTAPPGTYTSGGVTITWALSNGGHTLTGSAGATTVLVATIDNSGHYTVTLSAPIDTPNGVNAGENGGDSILAIGVTATDNFGNTLTSGTLTVNVEDDHPIASPDTNSTSAGTTLTVTVASSSDVLHNDVSGADGYAAGGGVVGVAAGTNTSVALSTGVGTVIHGTYGDLTLNADGSYSYVAKPNVTGVDHFVYTIADGDGDTSTTTLNITVNPVTASVGTGSTVVSEEVLLAGTEHGGDTDSDSSNDVLVNSGNITLSDSISGATFTTALTAPPGTYTSGGTTITWALSNGGHTLTGSAGATTVLVATIDNSGHYTVTLSAPIDTPNGVNAGENGGDSILTIGITATDNFGNTLTSGSLTVHVEDDAPIASTNGNGVGTVTLDESAVGTDTPGGSPPVGLASATISLAAGFATAVYGADGPGSVAYSLHLTGSNVASGLYALDPTDTSTSDGDGYGQGSQIVLNQSGNTITGSVGSTTYFTITINPSTGVATFTQVNNIWNPVAGSSAAALDDPATLMTAVASALQVQQTVTDHDGDTSTASINIGQGVFIIEDSGPTVIHPDSITTTDIVQGPLFAYLDTDHSVSENFGTDGPGSITFANITNGMDSGLTSGGASHHITYWLSTDGQTLEGRVDSTTGSDGTLVFEVHIDQSTSQYDYQQFGIVDNGGGISFNDLTSSAAGNVDYRGVGADATGNPDADLLISGTQSDGTIGTVNTDSTAIGVANQSMDAGESARIDFVTGLTSGAATTTGFNFTGHIETNGFIGLIPQVQGSQSNTVDFTVYALESTLTGSGTPDSNPASGFSDGTLAHVTSVYVQDYLTGNTATLDISGLANGSTTPVGFGVTVTKNADGSVTFHGIQEGDHYGVNTATNFNAIIVHDVSGSFDLGIFSLTQTNAGNPINLSYDLQIKDADGDTVALPGAINIALDPTSQQAAVINNAVVTNNVVTTSSTSTSGLIPGNDNQHSDHRAFAVGQNTVLMGALAAAGLEAEHSRFDFHALTGGGTHSQTMTPLQTSSLVSGAVEQSYTASPTHIVETTVGSNPVGGQHGTSQFQAILEQLHGIGHGDAHAPVLTSLLNGSAPGAHGPVAHGAPIMASGVAMPSAQQLVAALGGHGQPQTSVAGVEHNQAVGQVLADALHGGGGHGPSIDTLLNGPASHATHDVIEALASHAGSAVPFSNSSVAAAFHGSHNMFSMNGMAHHDAAPHHG